MKIEFNTTKYVSSHGRKPRGCGSWAFDCPAISNSIIWAPITTNYSDAKRWMKEYVQTETPRGVTGPVNVHVCP